MYLFKNFNKVSFSWLVLCSILVVSQLCAMDSPSNYPEIIKVNESFYVGKIKNHDT